MSLYAVLLYKQKDCASVLYVEEQALSGVPSFYHSLQTHLNNSVFDGFLSAADDIL